MHAKVLSVTAVGLQTLTIEVEVNAGRGKPGIGIVGLPSKAVQESQDRVKTALQNCGIHFPAKKITINLAPADISKEGPSFDLPIALGILESFDIFQIPNPDSIAFVGELSLLGELRKTKGVLPYVLHAREKGFKSIVIPYQNAEEVNIISGITIIPVKHIAELIAHFQNSEPLTILSPQPFQQSFSDQPIIDFAHVHGQYQAKRALEIAAAGGHNILMNGSPGSGKSMLAQALNSILPAMTETEVVEVTTIYSVAGLADQGLIRSRPFRSPHHTISQVGLIGGGSKLRPGEISLAHRGILFLDEFPEFSHSAIEALRQPLEDHVVNISRASGSVRYPSNFTLVAAANPCPCGYALSKKRTCNCSQLQLERYEKKLSGPILDRIDLHVRVQEVEVKDLAQQDDTQRENSKSIQERVNSARQIQLKRYQELTYLTNSELSSQIVKTHCVMTEDAKNTLQQAVEKLHLSARSYFKMVKVAQTIADLANHDRIELEHVAEALQYR